MDSRRVDTAPTVIGQPRILEQIDVTVSRPVHAYLVSGPAGSGAEDVARHLAWRLLDGDERDRALIARGVHPDVVEFEPGGASYKVDDVRERIIPETMRVPVEGDRKVVIVREAERMCIIANAANAFLKTLEEPAPRTVIVLVSSAADELLPTIRSRCSRLDLDPVTDDIVVRALQLDGDDGTRVARLAGGQIGRARALAGDLAAVRLAFASAAGRLDGTGAVAAIVASELDAAVDAAVQQQADTMVEELRSFDTTMEDQGYAPRDAARFRRRIEERHRRAHRRARIDLLLEGVTAIESVILDVLGGGSPRNDDVVLPAWNAPSCAAALDACRAAREAFAVNEKGALHLEHLLLQLSAQVRPARPA
jgi:DNA polymerase-3 subunit delta'